MALEGFLRRREAGELQRGVVGACARHIRASRRRPRGPRTTSIRAPSITSPRIRPTRATSSLTFLNSSSIARCAEKPDSPGRSIAARSMDQRKQGPSFRRCSRRARASRGRRRCFAMATGIATDGSRSDARVFRAAQELARRAEQGKASRLVEASTIHPEQWRRLNSVALSY